MTERVGFWIDLEGAFRTGDPEYVESVWWSLHELWDRGLIYKGHKVVPVLPALRHRPLLARDGDGLRRHGGRDRDRAAAGRRAARAAEAGDALLIWTTQPWTLFANCAVAISPSLTLRARARRREVVVVAEERVEEILGDDGASARPLRRPRDRRHALRAAVRPPARPRAEGPHRARRRARRARQGHRPRPHRDGVRRGGLRAVRAARDPAREPGARGRHLRRAHHRLRGRCSSATPFRAWSPSCTRPASCGTPSPTCTAIRTAGAATRSSSTTRRSAGTSARATAATTCSRRTSGSTGGPSTCATAASATGCRATSTGRCRATATGARRCRSGSATPATRATASARWRSCARPAGALPEDLHRPYIDDVTWGCTVEGCGGAMQRVRATIDTWYDSACMPFAQFHYPFEGKREFAEQFPPTFICEGIDQTRGWFYTLARGLDAAVRATSPSRHAICVGHVQDAKGQQDVEVAAATRSTRGTVLTTHGADAFRWYYLASQQPWAGYRFSAERGRTRAARAAAAAVDDVRLLRALREHRALRRDRRRAAGARAAGARPLGDLAAAARDRADARADRRLRRDGGRAARRASGSRTSRTGTCGSRAAASGTATPAALATLRECLVETAKLLAPAVPFLAEEIYANLVGGAAEDFGAEPDSVHLCDYPEPDAALRRRAARARHGARARGRSSWAATRARRSRVKVRQPLPRVRRAAATRGRGGGRPAARAGR